MYSEIINHYTNNKSNVYSYLLDASKAFDLGSSFLNFLKNIIVYRYTKMHYTINFFIVIYDKEHVLHGIL